MLALGDHKKQAGSVEIQMLNSAQMWSTKMSYPQGSPYIQKFGSSETVAAIATCLLPNFQNHGEPWRPDNMAPSTI